MAYFAKEPVNFVTPVSIIHKSPKCVSNFPRQILVKNALKPCQKTFGYLLCLIAKSILALDFERCASENTVSEVRCVLFTREWLVA